MSPLTAPVVFRDKTPKTAKQLAELQERYRKAFGRELPASVALAMNKEKKEPEKS